MTLTSTDPASLARARVVPPQFVKLRDKHGAIVPGVGVSTCGKYTLAEVPYAGEVWFTAYYGKDADAVFLQRSLERADCERAVADHMAHVAFPVQHESNDGQ